MSKSATTLEKDRISSSAAGEERARRELVVAVARRIRSRLTALEGNLPLLRPLVSEEESGVLNELDKDCQALCAIADEFLEFATLEAQAPAGPRLREPASIHELVRRAVGETAEEARARRILISSRLPDALPPVHADVERLKQALARLLLTLIRLSPRGAVVTIEAAREEGLVRLYIFSDGGQAIPQSALEAGSFTKHGPAPCDSPEGPGLGLLIARQLLKEHGGELTVGEPAADRPRGAWLTALLPVQDRKMGSDPISHR